jgi:hypothetical protein
MFTFSSSALAGNQSFKAAGISIPALLGPLEGAMSAVVGVILGGSNEDDGPLEESSFEDRVLPMGPGANERTLIAERTFKK